MLKRYNNYLIKNHLHNSYHTDEHFLFHRQILTHLNIYQNLLHYFIC
jgi:hypothetical protein